MEKLNVFWFRRDLRLKDNKALNEALKEPFPVLCVFVFDKEILQNFNATDSRLGFIHHEIEKLHRELLQQGSGLLTFHSRVMEAFGEIISRFAVQAVYLNTDYEPAAIRRDENLRQYLQMQGIIMRDFKDQVIFDKEEVLKADLSPYTIFTPYSKKWKERLQAFPIESEQYANPNFHQFSANPVISLGQLGFHVPAIKLPPLAIDLERIRDYHLFRDQPRFDAGTRLGLHLRFGTLSIRKLVQIGIENNQVFLNELIWREFFMSILYHFPQVETQSFKKAYDRIAWRNNEQEFITWCKGETGFPIVDAGMRELAETGYMHNRVRMITASFLCKHLLIDWRWGEAYFASQLLDYELSSNNGNWQWAAGSGCDAAPYFRVFNPVLQQQKHDRDAVYICKWVPDYNKSTYPPPMLDLSSAKARCIAAYQKALRA